MSKQTGERISMYLGGKQAGTRKHHISAYRNAHTRTRTHAHAHMHTHSYTHIHTQARTHTHTHRHSRLSFPSDYFKEGDLTSNALFILMKSWNFILFGGLIQTNKILREMLTLCTSKDTFEDIQSEIKLMQSRQKWIHYVCDHKRIMKASNQQHMWENDEWN